jgi:hypothetical protein
MKGKAGERGLRSGLEARRAEGGRLQTFVLGATRTGFSPSDGRSCDARVHPRGRRAAGRLFAAARRGRYIEEDGTGGGARAKNLAKKIEALRQKRGRYGALLAELERTGESQISLTDPDSRAMAAHTKVGVGYNAQVAVDAKHKMIVEQAVTNQVVDIGLLMQTAEPARVILDVERIDVVADRGYFKIEDIEACEKAGLTPHVPKPQRGPAARKGFFTKEEFRYDPARDVYICPEEAQRRFEAALRGARKVGHEPMKSLPPEAGAVSDADIEKPVDIRLGRHQVVVWQPDIVVVLR